MKESIKSLIPQKVINQFYHLPKAFLANVLYGFPTKKLKVIGVTGTDGKTTTVNMIYQILKDAGKKVSMVSTVNAYISGKVYETGFHVTSPDPFMVQKFARKAKDCGDEYLILEVTSHALDQYRFWGIKFDIGVITNVTHEHLDYHKTFENYLRTKLKLLKDVKFAIVNAMVRGVGVTGGKTITFGLESGDFNQKSIKLNLKISGDYNMENALAAMAVSFVLNIPKQTAKITLENFRNVSGRMEEVKNNRGIKIIIDFAHTPNGLEQALKTLRSRMGRGKLIALIGCEGFRDEGKRSMMGAITQKISDIVVVTAVDPRGQLETINRQIMQGAKNSGAIVGKNFYVIDDREEAIDFAVRRAKKGDMVGIFGKGHEKSMNVDGKHELPWSDREAVGRVLGGIR